MFEYQDQGRRTPHRSRAPRVADDQSKCLWHPGAAIVVTLLEPSVRNIIDGATDGDFTRVHAETVSEAARAVHEHHATTLLLSPSVTARGEPFAVNALLSKSPALTAVAILADDWPAAHAALLDLGACGVTQVVNLASREGWNRLRALIGEANGRHGQLVVRLVLDALQGASDEAARFFATLVRVAPTTATVRRLASTFAISPNTLMSRFLRARLPSPKAYLSMTRLLYAASFLETPRVSVSAAADALHFSSPQSFGRHVRQTLGLTAGEFRRQVPLQAALEHFRARLVEPYREALKAFRPLPPVGGRTAKGVDEPAEA